MVLFPRGSWFEDHAAVLLMIAAAVAVLCRRPLRSLREGSWYALLCGGLVLAIAMSGKLNIGVRHILALYPFLAVAASCLLARSGGPISSQPRAGERDTGSAGGSSGQLPVGAS